MAENIINSNLLKRGDTTEDSETNYSLDTLIRKLGRCGRFQIVFVSLGYFPLVPASWGLLFMIYGNYNPGFKCDDVSLVNDTTLSEYGNNIAQTAQMSQGNLSEYRTSLCTCDTFKSNNNWTFSKAASTVVTEWGLVCEDSWKSSTVISVQMTGVLLGACAGGQIGDRFGRKFSVHGGAALLAVTNVIAIFSTSWVMYAAVRFFIGFASGCMLSTIVIYNIEFIPSFWRAFLVTFPFWSLSIFGLGLCVVALKDWRQIHMTTAFLALLAFLPVFWIPESMRYLTVHGHLERAKKTVLIIARLNRRPIPDTSIMTTIAEREKESMKSRPSYTYLDLFYRSIRKYTIVLGNIWFICSVLNNAIMFGLMAFTGDFFVNLLFLSVLPVPSRALTVLIASKFGRKKAVATSICISFVCSIIVVGIQLAAPTKKTGITTTALALGSNMFIEAAWGALLVLTAELFPTGMRNMSFAYCNVLARFGGMISPYLISRQSLPMWSVFLIVGMLQMIAFVSVLTLPESKGRLLQENLEAKATQSRDSEINSNV